MQNSRNPHSGSFFLQYFLEPLKTRGNGGMRDIFLVPKSVTDKKILPGIFVYLPRSSYAENSYQMSVLVFTKEAYYLSSLIYQKDSD